MNCSMCGVAIIDTLSDTIFRSINPTTLQSSRVCLDCFSATPPKIICLCGSTRFHKIFDEITHKKTMEGYIVLSIGSHYRSDDDHPVISLEEKRRLDRLHMWKIQLADEIFVINVGHYIGESTSREIAYATQQGKPIHYLEDPKGDYLPVPPPAPDPEIEFDAVF